PWPVGAIDPHDQFDPGAALFGPSLFDPLFSLEASGDPYPTLAADAPTTQGAKTIVRLREGLVTAKGKKLDAKDLLFSLDRAPRAALRFSTRSTSSRRPTCSRRFARSTAA